MVLGSARRRRILRCARWSRASSSRRWRRGSPMLGRPHPQQDVRHGTALVRPHRTRRTRRLHSDHAGDEQSHKGQVLQTVRASAGDSAGGHSVSRVGRCVAGRCTWAGPPRPGWGQSLPTPPRTRRRSLPARPSSFVPGGRGHDVLLVLACASFSSPFHISRAF